MQSSKGPVWITSPALLREYDSVPPVANILLIEGEEELQTTLVATGEKINIGWLYLPNKGQTAPLNIAALPVVVQAELKPIIDRLVLVPDSLFSQVVNDNLEVRTSVAIDPATGAAVDGALFTYEAIPRATVMLFDVVYNDPAFFAIAGQEIKKDVGTAADTAWVKENVEKGLAYFEYAGLGGMNTRGMGRFKILNLGGA